jgi:pyruvate kinase
MLSGETAVGTYPIETLAYMDRIIKAVEPSLGYRHQMPDPEDKPTVGRAMSNAACDLAEALGARAILVPTATGRTASAVARLRPRRPIIGLTHNRYALQQMALEWGVIPLHLPEATDVQELWDRAIAMSREAGLVDPGDWMVITAGTSVNLPGTTNLIKVDVA